MNQGQINNRIKLPCLVAAILLLAGCAVGAGAEGSSELAEFDSRQVLRSADSFESRPAGSTGTRHWLRYTDRSISLDSVYGLYGTSTDSILAGDSVKFFIRVTGDPDSTYSGFSNGFRVYSPDGAQWTTTYGDTTGTLGQADFNLGFGINNQSISGSGADTVGFWGVDLGVAGLAAGFDDVAFTLTIGPIGGAYDGTHICLDSTFFAAGGLWLWTSSGGDIVPDWLGPYCFTVVEALDRTTWYVDSLGSDIGGDGSPGNPFRTIQHGIDMADNGDTVMVMPGTYFGAGNRNISPDGKELLITSMSGPSVTIIDNSSSYYGFQVSSGEMQSTVIEGFTLTDHSAGLHCSNSGITVRSCVFEANDYGAYGGALGRLHVEDCDFEANDTAAVMLLSNCILFDMTNSSVGNHSIYGLRSEKSNPGDVIVDSCDFFDNWTHFWGSVTVNNSSVQGGSVGMTGIITMPALLNAANNTEFFGISSLVIDVIEVTNLNWCTIRNNSGRIAEAYNNQRLYLEDCDIYDNTGSGIYVDASGGDLALLNMKRCTYTGNGDGIKFYSGVPLLGIYGLYLDSCTVADNDSTGVFSDINGLTPDKISIKNSIITGNDLYGLELEPGNVVQCCNVADNGVADYAGISDQTGTNGNVSVNPLFCDPSSGNYWLSIGSECLPDNNSCGVQMGARSAGCSIGADEVRIVRPLSGELTIEETQYPIQWLKGDNIGNVNVEYSVTAGLSWVSIVSGFGGLEFDWEVPEVLVSTEALIRVYSSAKGPFGDTTGSAITLATRPVDDGSQCAEAESEDSVFVGGNAEDEELKKHGSRDLFPTGVTLAYRSGEIVRHHGDPVTKCTDVNADTLCDGFRGLSGFHEADVNNDEHFDVVLVNHDSATLAVFLGDGAGNYVLYGGGKGRGPIGTHPNDIGIADFDQDGDLDTWLVGSGPNLVRVLLGNGEGGYEPTPWQAVLPDEPVHAVNGDLNDDGYDDLAVVGTDGAIRIFIGYGNGTFYGDTVLYTGHGAGDLIVADLDANGLADIGAATSDDSGYFAAFLYSPGSFELELYPASVHGDAKIGIADFLGNGMPDIVLISPPDDKLVVLPGMDLGLPGTPRFGYPWEMDVGNEPVVLEVADYNLDGRPDVYVANLLDMNALAYHGDVESSVDVSLSVTSPNGGEELWIDSGSVITWTKGEGVLAVDVQVSRNNGSTWETVAENLSGLSYDWTVWGPTSDNAIVRVRDATVFARYDVSDASFEIRADCCVPPIRGDINYDMNGPNIVDVTFLALYLFSGGDAPPCPDEADVNGDSISPNILDLTTLVAYMFSGGPPPASCP